MKVGLSKPGLSKPKNETSYFAVSWLIIANTKKCNYGYLFQLNFARFRRHLKGFRKTTTNTQIVGFTDLDSYEDVLLRAARSLGLKCDSEELKLVCSGGLVLDSLDDQPWTLGKYIQQNGGTQNRSKRVWGIYIPVGLEYGDADPRTQDSVKSIGLRISGV